MKEFVGRTAVVTGGARGFGKAFGRALVEQGAAVVLSTSMALPLLMRLGRSAKALRACKEMCLTRGKCRH